jgi:phage shock protein PspC (stress-responsive transcriptional regulator)
MAENEKSSTEETKGARPERRLLRSRDERMLWGVAGGLGEYLNIDPTLVRLGFAVAAFFGGFGLIAYLVMAVVVPEDDGTGRPSSGRRPPTWAIVLLAIAVLIVIPGPFFGWRDGWDGGPPWWGFFGPLWLLFLVAAGFLAVRALRGGRPLFGRRPTSDAARAKDTSGEAGTAETEERGAAPPRVARAIALVVLALAAICAALCVAAVAAWATATGQGDVVAGVVIAIGAAIAATAFIADARRVAPWLLASALLLAAPAGAIAAADIHFDGGIGERSYSPASVEDLPPGYEFGVGQMEVDLRDLAWAEGQAISLDTTLGIGQMIVSVPSHVCVDTDAKVKAGELIVRGESSDGVDAEIDQSEPTGTAPRLELDAELQLGQLVVTDRDPVEVEEHNLSDSDYSDERDAQREACAR